MTLPKLKGVKSFFLRFDDTYYSGLKYGQWQKRDFQIDSSNFQGSRIHRLNAPAFLDRKRVKGKRLKVKMIYDAPLGDVDCDDLCELLPTRTDVIVFVTGGGFVSDFERVSQFYLREIVKEHSIPVFIIKYRYCDQSRSRSDFPDAPE